MRRAPAGRRPVLRAVRRPAGRGAGGARRLPGVRRTARRDRRGRLLLGVRRARAARRHPHRTRPPHRRRGERPGPRAPAKRGRVPPRGGRRAERGGRGLRRHLVGQRRERRRPRRRPRRRRSSSPRRWPTPDADAESALLEAINAANEAVVLVEWTTRTRRVDPSCTLVSALCRGAEIAIGWVGDSRAYWFDAGAGAPADRSTTRSPTRRSPRACSPPSRRPRARSCTRSPTGSAPTPRQRPPRLVTLRPDRPGRLVLCTDGLWNYAPGADELARLVEALPTGAAPAAVARALTDTANARGGHDNITVAVVDIDPSAA